MRHCVAAVPPQCGGSQRRRRTPFCSDAKLLVQSTNVSGNLSYQYGGARVMCAPVSAPECVARQGTHSLVTRASVAPRSVDSGTAQQLQPPSKGLGLVWAPALSIRLGGCSRV